MIARLAAAPISAGRVGQRLQRAQRQRWAVVDVVLVVERPQLRWPSPSSAPSRAAVDSAAPSAAPGNASPAQQVVPVAVGGQQSRDGISRPDRGPRGARAAPRGRSASRSRTPHPPPRTAVHVVCQTSETNTSTSACRARARIGGRRPGRPPGPASRCRAAWPLLEARDLGVGLLLPGFQLLLVAVDPDDRDLLLQQGLDVVVVAGGDVHPALLGADPPLGLGEVRRVGLVGADLLSGDDEVEVERDVAPGLARAACRRCWRSAPPCRSCRPSAGPSWSP